MGHDSTASAGRGKNRTHGAVGCGPMIRRNSRRQVYPGIQDEEGLRRTRAGVPPAQRAPKDEVCPYVIDRAEVAETIEGQGPFATLVAADRGCLESIAGPVANRTQ